VRSLEEISKNLLGDLKIEFPFKVTNTMSPLRDIHEWIFSHSLMMQYFVICGSLVGNICFAFCIASLKKNEKGELSLW
jgi:hypothetical protein